jgi:hypothetical protein
LENNEYKVLYSFLEYKLPSKRSQPAAAPTWIMPGASSELTPTNVGAAEGCDLLIFDPYKKLV